MSDETVRLSLTTYLEMKKVCVKKITKFPVASNNLWDRFIQILQQQKNPLLGKNNKRWVVQVFRCDQDSKIINGIIPLHRPALPIWNELQITSSKILNKAFCLQVFKHLQQPIHQKGPNIWMDKWILHITRLVKQYQCLISTVPIILVFGPIKHFHILKITNPILNHLKIFIAIQNQWEGTIPKWFLTVWFEVLITASIKNTIFWGVMPCSLVEVYWCSSNSLHSVTAQMIILFNCHTVSSMAG
jgi:hypothetical protein